MSTATTVLVACTCTHALDCSHECHLRLRGTGALASDLDYPPDASGVTRSGCADCTPGQALAHHVDCPTLVPVEYLWGSPELA